MNKRKKRMFEKLRNKEHRDAFVQENINIGIPFQIKTLREQRNLTQKDFEKLSGMKQASISRLENPNYSGFTLSTLKKIASKFDIGLIVRFVPLSDIVKWELNLNTESLKALSYEDDPYFKEEPEEELITEQVMPTEKTKLSLVGIDNISKLNEYSINKRKSEIKNQLERQATKPKQFNEPERIAL